MRNTVMRYVVMRRRRLQVSILLVALVLLLVGVILEQYNEVILKAINICLECIGIG